jgi:osmotically-inducible protein OsmY
LKVAAKQVSRPDESIAADVWANILREESIRTLDRDSIRLEVKDGEVTLWGHVVKPAHRTRVEELAARVRGVVAVHNRLVVDHDLAVEIAQALARDERTRPYILSVNCYHGWVTLVGEVPTSEAQQAAEEVAASHPLGRGVIALPRVSGQSAAPSRRPLQPEVGARVYTRSGLVAHVSQVVIDPRNRLVSHLVITLDGSVYGGQTGLHYVLPAEAIDFVREGSVWLKAEAASQIRLSPFVPEQFPLAPSDWQPPFPYKAGTIRWPAEARGAK